MIEHLEWVDDPIDDGGYRYMRTHAWWLANFGTRSRRFAYLGENLMHLWVPADAGREWVLSRQVTGRRRWLVGDQDQAEAEGFEIVDRWPEGSWRARFGDFEALSSGRRPSPDGGSWQRLTDEFIRGLPSDPVQLLDRLQADSPCSRNGYSGPFSYASNALRSGLLTAEWRRRFSLVMTRIPGVTVERRTIEETGRPAIVLRNRDGVHDVELYLDPASGHCMGERVTSMSGDERGLAPGVVTKSSTISMSVNDGQEFRELDDDRRPH